MATVDLPKIPLPKSDLPKTGGLKVVNIHEAKTHLSRLVEEVVAHGEPVIIAKAGKPMVKVIPLDHPPPRCASRRLGFLKGMFEVPLDIKTPFKDEIEEMFYGKE